MRFKFWHKKTHNTPFFLVLCLLLFLLAFIPRFLWAISSHPPPFSDMEDYYLCAINFLKGSYLAMSPERLAYRAPLYPLFLACCLKISPGNGLLAIRIIQSIIASFSPVILFILLYHLMKPLAATTRIEPNLYLMIFPFFGALSFAWMQGQIFFSSILMTETLFIFLLLVWALLGTVYVNENRYWILCLFSLVLGLLALVRPVALIFLPILIYKTLNHIPRPEWKKQIWLPLFAWIIPILPWTVRNAIVLHHFVPLTTNSGVNFYIGHNPYYGYYSTGNKEYIRKELASRYGYNEILEDRYFFNLGLAYIFENPSSLISHSLKKLYFLYIYQKVPWPWEEYNRGKGLCFYGDFQWPLLSCDPSWLILVFLGGIYAFYMRLNHGMILSLILLYTLACVIYFARTRFRLPIEPFLMAYIWIGIAFIVESGYRLVIENHLFTKNSK